MAFGKIYVEQLSSGKRQFVRTNSHHRHHHHHRHKEECPDEEPDDRFVRITRNELDTIMARERDLTAAVETLSQENGVLKASYTAAITDKQRLQADVSILQTRIRDLSRENQDLRRSVEASAAAVAVAAGREEADQVRHLRDRVARLKVKKHRLRERLGATVAQLQADLSRLARELRGCREAYDVRGQRCDDLERLLSQQRHAYRQLDEENRRQHRELVTYRTLLNRNGPRRP